MYILQAHNERPIEVFMPLIIAYLGAHTLTDAA
jgi:hypothetical protein